MQFFSWHWRHGQTNLLSSFSSEHSCAIILLQAILHASLDRSALSVEKFARWLRAICTILLARNTAPDRLKAIGYIEQAITVLEEHGGDDVGDEVMTI